MYEDHFGLTGRPFQLTPDPRFWFDTATHRKAMAYLGYGLAQGEGFIVITGDIGAGKTTLVGHLMATIDRERLHVDQARVDRDRGGRPAADRRDRAGRRYGRADQGAVADRDRARAACRRAERAADAADRRRGAGAAGSTRSKNCACCPTSRRAAMRCCRSSCSASPNSATGCTGRDRLEQLRQRVIAIHHLDPMEARRGRAVHGAPPVAASAGRGSPDFTDDAFAALYRGSDGVPRRLNQLAGARDAARRDRAASSVIDGRTGRCWSSPTSHGDMPRRPAPIAAARRRGRAGAGIAPSATLRSASPIAVAALEARLEEQDAALRRVLTLLVDWVEGTE